MFGRRVVILFSVFLFVYFRVVAQQQALYNQFLQHKHYINPGFSGTDGVTEFSLFAREQWVGYKEGPRTYSLNFQMNLLGNPLLIMTLESKSVRRGSSARTASEIFKQASMGVAGTLINDVNGRIRRTGIQASYSYQILAEDWLFGAGFGISFMQYKVNILPEDLFNVKVDDPLIASGKPIIGYAPDFNFGVIASNGDYWGGISANALLQNALQFGTYNEKYRYRQPRQFYLMSGYRILLRHGVVLEPSTVLTLNQSLLWTGDLNIKVEYFDKFWAAVGYRTLSDMVVMGGVWYGRMTFSYAFSYTIAGPPSISKYGSHEFMVAFRVKSPLQKK